MTDQASTPAPEWPPQDLETLNQCPVCHSPHRTLRYSDLEDWSFRAAPGRWSLWVCSWCRIDYLDPRPNTASIGRAYSQYYTHESTPDNQTAAGYQITERATGANARGRIKTTLRNGYLAARFGHQLTPRSLLGSAFSLMSSRALETDLAVRHLPPPTAPDAKLLDVGCGNGAFLQEARYLGYSAVGIDPDAQAVAYARKRGLDVRQGGLPSIDLPSAAFEHITLSHVIEHLHDPVGALQQLRRLLTPRGRLWIATPNMTSATFHFFGKHWRGLESPRHLCIFNQENISNMLLEVGYKQITFYPHPPRARFFVSQSLLQQQGKLPYEESSFRLSKQWREVANRFDRDAKRCQSQADVLIVSASPQE